MGKTEQEIMEKINKTGLCVVMHGYRTGRKVGAFGNRMFNAAIKLRDAGLVTFKSSDSYIDCKSCYSDHWSEIVLVKVAK